MADVIRTLTALQALWATNTTRAVSAQDLRDGLVSVLGVAPFVAKTADYTATENDQFISVDATAAQVTITLPAVATARVGKVYTIKKVDVSANAASLNPNASETIDGSATTIDITTQWASLTVINTGAAWLAVSEYTP
jgi:hypothetical protein